MLFLIQVLLLFLLFIECPWEERERKRKEVIKLLFPLDFQYTKKKSATEYTHFHVRNMYLTMKPNG